MIRFIKLHKSNYFKMLPFDERAFFFYQRVKLIPLVSKPYILTVDLRLPTLGLKDFSTLFLFILFVSSNRA